MELVKCLVWDLDDTLWPGAIGERSGAAPSPAALRTLELLDGRGILHAVASRGDTDRAVAHLRAHGVDELFSAVEVGWGPKSAAVRRIADELGLALDAVAFVDDDPVERAEVAAALPQVRCYPADRVGVLPDLPELTPAVVTEEARHRRRRYREDRLRRADEREFAGTSAEFLASLGLVMTVRRAGVDDLARAHELTVRTHQLNTTGVTFDIAELRALTSSDRHEVLVADLRDRFGGYGTIGLAVTELRGGDAVLRLLLMSCRVLSRGVGTVLIGHVVDRARAAGRRPMVEFVPTEVNRVMLVTLRFAGFEVARTLPDRLLLAHRGAGAVPGNPHVDLRVADGVC
ncbi:HAD-IIIC family phosphatase [Nocardia blacklockiae]|uniref:HAD-IIIC family phosphatase n=1 Tax=Nocardia blacklockiae TaxID=480036 RepID=UPI001893C4BF|nr:HAD-IIIC family phosphatase [Nocardia blacklockiae]MBF6175774.1 HAD-IIIC family phosphatase [Nocardia blacklockiae]